MSQRLYAFGSNGSGQLGIGHKDDVSVPTVCELNFGGVQDDASRKPNRIKAIQAGGNHTFILDEDGNVHASGALDDGRAGTSANFNTKSIWTPVSLQCKGVEPVNKFGSVAATWESSAFVDDIGKRVFTCGVGNKGELGHGKDVIQSPRPEALLNFPPHNTQVVDIASCMSHTVAVLSNGEVWGWGGGRRGQLGDPAENVWRPRKIEGIAFKAVRATCGREFTVIAACPDDGSFTVMGSDKWNVCSAAPSSLKGWKQIEASWSSVYASFHDGRLMSWGRNDRGQLAPDGVPLLEQIAAGSEHVLARTNEGRVIAWGWGEHGNCGEKAIESKANEVAIDGPVAFVGAGCATSFLVL